MGLVLEGLMFRDTDDIRIDRVRPLIPPAILMEELPISEQSSQTVAESREVVQRIVRGEDPRLLVVVGPCSIHDPVAALEYARKLHSLAQELRGSLSIIMRVYFEKPRTTVGWKGLVNDPSLDGSFQINTGLRMARSLLRSIVDLGLPTGTEFLDTITPQFIADLVSWGAIGARTTESQVHRELASGLSMPCGFKNGTDGNVDIAIDAVRAASHPHHFLSVTKQGIAAIVATRGNDCCHVVLRGAKAGPNHDAAAISAAVQSLEKANLPGRVMVDCSHGNSQKDHRRQHAVAISLAEQISAGSDAILGVMIESHLVEGRQDFDPTIPLRYGQSITDACVSWEQTEPMLRLLADAVASRR
jgi:3-deoxy-7-phosphoheptulonate synthase